MKDTPKFTPKNADEGRPVPNCIHGWLRYKDEAVGCCECGIPYGAEGLYWPKETMPEFDFRMARPTTIPTNEDGSEFVNHPLQIGDAVTVFAYDNFSPFIEGIGIVDSHAAAADHYWIRFDHDPTARLRFVQADWQAFPDRALALLRAFWRSCRSNQSTTENFFPDNGTSAQNRLDALFSQSQNRSPRFAQERLAINSS